MALRQPSLTIPSTSHHEDCANTWQEISQSCLKNLEAVDVSKAKIVTSRKTFLVQFAKWQQSPNIRSRKALGDWNSIPDCLENFEQHISSLYYDKANTAYLWGMTLVALEAAEGSAYSTPLMADGNNVILRVGEMLVTLGQKLQLLSGLGIKEPHTQQETALTVYRNTVSFLETLIICLRKEPIENLKSDRWSAVEDQYQITEQKLKKSYDHIKELHVLRSNSERPPVPTRQNSMFSADSISAEFSKVRPVPHVMMLPSRNTRFSGRRQNLKNLSGILNESILSSSIQSLTIWGLGGVGKTELVREFAYISEKYNDVTIWIPSQSLLSIDQGFTAAALRLRLPGATAHDDRQNKMVLLDWFSQTFQRWLLVFNNVEDHRLIRSYVPNVGNGAVIFTTRSPNISYDLSMSSMKLEPFPDDEGVECLLGLSTAAEIGIKPDLEAATYLNHQLGGLPLAISQIAAFMRSRRMTMGSCIELYTRSKKRTHRLAGKSAFRYSDYEQDLSTIWELQFRSLESSEAKILLGILIFMAPDSVPAQLFSLPQCSESCNFPDELLFCRDPFSFSDAEEVLLDLALVQKTPESGNLSLHRLVQTEFQFFISAEERQKDFHCATLLLNKSFPKRIPGHKMHALWDKCDTFVEHVLSLTTAYQSESEDIPKLKASKELCGLIDNCAWYLYEVAKFGELKTLIETGFQACKEFPDDIDIQLRWSSIFNTQAQSFNTRGFFEDAMCAFNKSMDIKLKHLGNKDKSLMGTYSNISLLHETLGNVEKALEYRQMSLELLLLEPSTPEREVLVAMRDAVLARCLIRQGKFQECEDCLNNMLGVFSKSGNWFLMAHTHYTFGRLWMAVGDMSRSESSFKESNRFMVEVGKSENHPFTTATLYKLGCLSFDKGEFQKALTMFEGALKIIKADPMLDAHKPRLLYMIAITLPKQVNLETGGGQNSQIRSVGLLTEAITITKKIRPTLSVDVELSRDIFDALVPGQSQ